MKAFFFTLLILTGAFLLWDFFFSLKSHQVDVEEGFSSRPATVPAPGVAGQPAANVTTAHFSSSPAGFTPPQIETLESLTGNWTSIPPTAFPRQVKLLREIEFKIQAGSSKLPPGSSAVALSFDDGMMSLAPVEGSVARGTASLDDTDLKARLAESYAKWAAARVETFRKQWERQQKIDAASAPREMAVGLPGSCDEAGKPLRNPDGTFPLLVASMTAGQVTDITPKKIKMWGTPQLTTMEGRPTWVIDVNYDTIVFCGPLEARAQAHIRDGKVIRWVFPGSGEPVP